MYAVFFHAHQKIDKLARQKLAGLLPKADFPSFSEIKKFEGQHGPDATKLKNRPGHEQPWHFYDPFDPKDTELLDIIEDHYRELVTALKTDNPARTAFEAAWLAHALVDGLTPAHHYPYEEELKRLRGGKERHSRKTLTSRAVIKGDTMRDSVRKSLQLAGPKGLLMNHTTFEGGAYTILQLMNFRKISITKKEISRFRKEGLRDYFVHTAREIAERHMYERFIHAGWTPVLANEVRRYMLPAMIKMVTLAWYGAAVEAQKGKK